MKYLYLFLVLVVFSNNVAFTQEITQTEWVLEQRCIPAATLPPDDWTFDGTILAAGWAGIHGINAAWQTPHILAFTNRLGSYGAFGLLSPDGRWYAIPEAKYTPLDIYQGKVDVTRLLIFDLTGQSEVLSLSWEESYGTSNGSGVTRFYTHRSPVWFDEDTFIYQRGQQFYFVDVPSLEVRVWSEPDTWPEISPVWVDSAHPSPDWSRIIAYNKLFNIQTHEILTTIYQPTANIDVPSVAWHPASTEFIVSGGLSATLYDVDGKLLDVISTAIGKGEFNHLFVENFSPDGRWISFSHYSQQPSLPYNTLVLANRADRTLIETCLDRNTSVQFSPDGRYVALLNDEHQLQILDIEAWQLYNTGIYHEGALIGWAAY